MYGYVYLYDCLVYVITAKFPNDNGEPEVNNFKIKQNEVLKGEKIREWGSISVDSLENGSAENCFTTVSL